MVGNFLTPLLVFMIVGAIIALETKDLLSAIISVGAVGFGLSIAFLLLRAPDIAIVQIVVEILALVILIRATISRDTTSIADDREFFSFTATFVFILILLVAGVEAIRLLPAFGETTSQVAGHYLSKGLSETGAANTVTSVILDYRAYDTLGEATVLFTAILGALAILRKKAKQ